MKVLIVGGGGREHALAWALARSPRVDAIFAAPGNGGTAGLATNVDVAAGDIDGLVELARARAVDLTVVGPEAPLVAGIADRFADAGLRLYGPHRDAARLEGSKVFAKEFMARHGIPTAEFAVFTDADAARAYVRDAGRPLVVKADGLAAGKGVTVARTTDEALGAIDAMMVDGAFGNAGARVVVEECLEGEEVSVHAVCAADRAVVLPSSQDHKRAFDGDRGPNTGGMGAIAPVPWFGENELRAVRERVIDPCLRGMADEGTPFSGTLYAGLMWTADGPRVLEFNVRFGDPETQAILPLVEGDLFELLYAAAGDDPPAPVALHRDRATAAVVMASRGYPGAYARGVPIDGLDAAASDHVAVFHAGTARGDAGVVTSGGRVLAVSAWGGDLRAALAAAYDAVGSIRFEGAVWRTDIGHRALARQAPS